MKWSGAGRVGLNLDFLFPGTATLGNIPGLAWLLDFKVTLETFFFLQLRKQNITLDLPVFNTHTLNKDIMKKSLEEIFFPFM